MSVIKGQWRMCNEMPDVVVDSEDYVIAEFVSIDDKDMIIAAPDMYLALVGLVDAFENMMGNELAAKGALYVAAAEAIAKARGQS